MSSVASEPAIAIGVKTLAIEATKAAVTSIIPLSLVLFAYERGLVPLYGSGPTTNLLGTIILGAVAIAAVQPFKVSTAGNWLLAGMALSAAPNAAYWVAVLSSRRKDPVWGPIFTHAVVLVPLILVISTLATQPEAGRVRSKNTLPSIVYRLTAGGSTYYVATALWKKVWPRVSHLDSVSESQIYLLLAGIAYSNWILRLHSSPASSSIPKKDRKASLVTPFQVKSISLAAFIALWSSVYPKLASPVLPHPLPETYTHPSFPLQIHTSVQSVTGVISVGEALPPPGHNGELDQSMHSVRYLRASHSILGGVWMGHKVQVLDDAEPVKDSFGTALGDSIYATFVLQEAARLVNSTVIGNTGKWKNSLVIGLGAGISATSFSRHGISNTIVEIDPAVYDAARRFFGLPDPGEGHVFLEDARSWTAKKRASLESGNEETLYDIVVHDCFSGGGVPEHIYTVEFWEDLKAITHPEGVLVVNFAGIVNSDSSRMIFQTLERSFSQCRAFHDMIGELTEEKYDSDFINVVLFCTPSTTPLTFRKARFSDYLGSPLRRHVLSDLTKREVNLDLLRATKPEDKDAFILTDAHNPLGKLQELQGPHHWSLMREVLTDIFWETY